MADQKDKKNTLRNLAGLFYRDSISLSRDFFWLLRELVSCPDKDSRSLLNKRYIREYLTYKASWAKGHGSDKRTYLGSGLLYYCLAYMTKAKLCVCLGSGGGFVPRMMRQAQRDLNIEGSKTVLVDANIGSRGRPQWLKTTLFSREHFFIRKFPEIDIIIDLTSNVAKRYRNIWKIDYLHIDADHSYEGSLQDFHDFTDLMSPGGIITFHDTKPGALDCWRTIGAVKKEGHEVLNFSSIGAGVAVIKIKSE